MNKVQLKIDYSPLATSLVNKKKLLQRLLDILRKRGIEGKLELGITLVTPSKIRALNHQYRQINKVTDVLSFPTQKSITAKQKLPLTNLGDIVVCLQQAKQQVRNRFINQWHIMTAKEKQAVLQKEIEFLIEHGLKHLIGEHHK